MMPTRKMNSTLTGKRNRAVGNLGEIIAARFLRRKGYKIITRNFRVSLGEIDIIAKKGLITIFVEVKTRSSLSFGPPYLAITEAKRKKMIECALCYLKMKDLLDTFWQIDIVSVELDGPGKHLRKIEHFENAVEE